MLRRVVLDRLPVLGQLNPEDTARRVADRCTFGCVQVCLGIGAPADRKAASEQRARFRDGGERSVRRYLRDGRVALSGLGAWPWAVVSGGLLPQRWWEQSAFMRAVADWRAHELGTAAVRVEDAAREAEGIARIRRLAARIAAAR